MKKIDEKVLQEIFDAIIHHFEFMKDECGFDLSYVDCKRYLIGAEYALYAASGRDYDLSMSMECFFEQKFDEYFGGKESE